MATSTIPELGPQLVVKINWKICILCQEENSEPLTQPKLETYSKLLSVVKERSSVCDADFIQV